MATRRVYASFAAWTRGNLSLFVVAVLLFFHQYGARVSAFLQWWLAFWVDEDNRGRPEIYHPPST
jgi:hypothetical protein